jgi:hypothetical protein
MQRSKAFACDPGDGVVFPAAAFWQLTSTAEYGWAAALVAVQPADCVAQPDRHTNIVKRANPLRLSIIRLQKNDCRAKVNISNAELAVTGS